MDDFHDVGLTQHKTRKALPADPWDDLVVSDRRGQNWHRAVKVQWRM